MFQLVHCYIVLAMAVLLHIMFVDVVRCTNLWHYINYQEGCTNRYKVIFDMVVKRIDIQRDITSNWRLTYSIYDVISNRLWRYRQMHKLSEWGTQSMRVDLLFVVM